VLRALPGASSGAEILDDLAAELTDAMMRDRIVDVAVAQHPLVAALFTGNELDLPAPRRVALQQALQRWADSGVHASPTVVLRLREPEDDDEQVWCLQVCLRREEGAPVPVSELARSAGTTRAAIEGLGQALSAYPPLRAAPAADAPFTLALTAADAVGLVGLGASALAQAGIALLLPRAWTKAEPSLRLKVDTPEPSDAPGRLGLDALLDYQWQLSLGDVELTDQEMSALAHANAPLVQLRGEWVQVDGAVLARAARYVAKHSQPGGTVGGMLAVLTGTDPPEVPVTEVQASGWWEQVLTGPHPQLSTVGSPAGLRAELRPYQQRGLDWLAFMSSLGLGVVLADDMGLGKTIQLLSLLLHETAARPTLLVCPMSVVGNWERETATFAPELQVLVHHGPGRRQGDDLVAGAAVHDLVLTTYAVLARDTDLRDVEWERVALDEAQHIKNSTTAQSRAARAVPARHRIALTGTPVENRLEELRSILDFANPGMLGSAQGFRKRFAQPIEREHDPVAVSRLRAATGPFVLRRLKTDPTVIADLPAKFEMTVRANLTTEQAGLYQAVVEEMLAKIEAADGMERKALVLTTLTRLKQVCNHPAHFLADGSAVLRRGQHRSGKLGLVEDVLDSVLGDGEKALLFTQFRKFGELVRPWFAERFGIDVPFLHGGVSKRGRDEMVADFQSDGGAPVMVLSLKAGGTGLNLTAANHVVHLDRWW
ncbi:MAG: SNF2-related protein, partial [Mycobacteriaceae bacterium]